MKEEFLSRFVRWHKQQYSREQQIIFLVAHGVFLLILLPLIIFFVSQKLDTVFAFSSVLSSPLSFYVGLLFFAIGLFLGGWAVWAQFQIGQGTPSPMMPTKKLVIKAPYIFCRNPMGLGTGVLFLGFGILFNSLSFVLITIFLLTILFSYFKFIEEKELIARFGEEYLEYKKRTPFLIPISTNKKLIIAIFFGVVIMLLGLLWFLQGAGIVHLQPIACVTNCEPITGKSPLWQVVGAITFFVGAVIIGMCAKRISRQRKT